MNGNIGQLPNGIKQEIKKSGNGEVGQEAKGGLAKQFGGKRKVKNEEAEDGIKIIQNIQESTRVK